MTSKLTLMLISGFLSLSSEATSPPALGKYRFVKAFTIEGCVEYTSGRGIVAHCKKTKKETFKPGREIQVGEFFWDDATKEFGAKIVFAGTNRSIPMQYLEKVDESKNGK